VRAADTSPKYRRAELVLDADGVQMPVSYVRPRLLASGHTWRTTRSCCTMRSAIDGLTAVSTWTCAVAISGELPVGKPNGGAPRKA